MITGVLSLSNFCTTGGVASVRQISAQTVDAIAHVLGGRFEIAIELEGGDDDRSSLPRDRTQFVDAVDGVDDFFDLLRDERFNFFAAKRRAGWCER